MAPAILQPDVSVGEVVEDIVYLFRYLGGIKFSEIEDPLDAPGSARLVATSNKFGLTFFSDLSGEQRLGIEKRLVIIILVRTNEMMEHPGWAGHPGDHVVLQN